MTPAPKESSLPWPSDPHLRRWMMFVDGENLTIRTQRLAADNGIKLAVGKHFMPDTFVWFPGIRGTRAITPGYLELQPHAIRASYYTSLVGDDDRIRTVREEIRELGFSPHVFKKHRREDKAKAVDVTLTKDLLVNAFFNNYDVAVLIAGDGDYVPVVEELKRLGKVLYLAFYEGYGLSPELHMASDHFFEMGQEMMRQWAATEQNAEGTR